MRSILRILVLGRAKAASFALVAVLASLGTATLLLEPWIYRAIIDDIAGVFVAPEPFVGVETFLEGLERSFEHLEGSARRLFRAPLQKVEMAEGARGLEERSIHQAIGTILIGSVLLVLIRAMSEGLRVWGDNLSTRLSNRIERDFILKAFSHVLRLPLGFFSRRASGAVARQIDQSDQIAPVFAAVSQEIWPDLFTLVSILTILLWVNWELALIVMFVVPAYGWLTWRMSGELDRGLEEYYERWDEVSSRIQQAIAGIKTVQAHGTSEFEADRLRLASDQAYDSYLNRNRLQNRYLYFQELLVALSKAAIVAMGGVKAIRHQLTPGDVVLFLGYLDRLYEPIQGLMGLYARLQLHIAAFHRAERLLQEPSAEGEELPPLLPKEGAIEFDRVAFRYGTNSPPVLDEVTFRVKPGTKVAIVGPSGAGKTTLADLVVALYRPVSGDIRIDGRSLLGVAPSSVRRSIREVAADGMLFRGSIADNIRYGSLSASDEAVDDAARLAGLGPVLERLPDGIKSPIGERGVELSVGERQRVLLARAFLARPVILILDEATANLDFRTEAQVSAAIKRLSQGRTTLLIAHRRSMLMDADWVLVLREGRIEQQGPPADLLTQEGYFRQMMQAQESTG